MKRALCMVLAVCMALSLAGCGECKHEWREASCTEPKTCTKCGVTEGEPAGHEWKEATYKAPKTCVVCGVTEGEPKENPYNNCKAWTDVVETTFVTKRGGHLYAESEFRDGIVYLYVDDIDAGDLIIGASMIPLLCGADWIRGPQETEEFFGIPKDVAAGELNGVTLEINNGEACLTLMKNRDHVLGWVSELTVSQENEFTKRVQEGYEEIFVASNQDYQTWLASGAGADGQ